MQLSIKVHNRLLELSSPKVMAIVNVTPDSFYTSFGKQDSNELLNRIEELIVQGADILDIGACSTRPNSTPIDAQEEWRRLEPVLRAIRTHFPQVIISVDTFRAKIAEQAILAGADIINDVYGGDADKQMWEVIAQYRVPYVLTYSLEVATKGEVKDYDYTMSCALDFFQSRLDALHRMGVTDVIIDPGFGFAKTQQQNYTILHNLDILAALNVPILAGISRKSMLYTPLGVAPADVLPATIAANTIGLERGANILRVHDVVAAKQAITIYSLTHKDVRTCSLG